MFRRKGLFESFSEMMEELREEVERLSSLLEDLDSPMWDPVECCLTPLSKIRDLGGEYEVTVDLPLVNEGSIKVYVEGNDVLKIDAEMKERVSFKRLGVVQGVREFKRFRKTIRFPEPVDPASLRIEFKRGLLLVKLRKA
ncbi:MAG: Hsp20/alpha crystallin family protein [Candidatus Nezhaarchaeota archaeon]|nr:Hsp20/alpha crystallin family protein [Candidatus Nezhaarchaeota archaeon]